jgi:preprotein translocase subunit SecY
MMNLPELKKKILVTLALLFVYRIGVFVPTPGIDPVSLAQFFERFQGTIVGMFAMFTGGALERFSVFALGIMPYISASIIIQLLTVVEPNLERLSKEGEQGRKKITQYTRYGTVILSIIQGFGIAVGLEGAGVVITPGWSFRIVTVITLTAGTAFIMWLGEQITERGIGNGISLIIFAGIVANMPSGAMDTFDFLSKGEIQIFEFVILIAVMIGVVALIIFFETAQRKIPVQYAKRVVGRKMFGGQSSHLPLKLNTSGVIPPIFASSILMFPATLANFVDIEGVKAIQGYLQPSAITYNVIYVAFIVFFCFFYTAVTFKSDDVADNMKKNGGFIPGIRPGKRTAEYIDKVLTRITVIGAIYVSAVCVLPQFLNAKMGIPFYFGGTALLIVIGVAMDTIGQIESHMMSRNYEGFLKK